MPEGLSSNLITHMIGENYLANCTLPPTHTKQIDVKLKFKKKDTQDMINWLGIFELGQLIQKFKASWRNLKKRKLKGLVQGTDSENGKLGWNNNDTLSYGDVGR